RRSTGRCGSPSVTWSSAWTQRRRSRSPTGSRRPQAMRSPGGAGMADVVLEVERSTGIARRAHSGSSTGGRVSTDSLTRALDGDQYEMNLSSPHSWRPLAVLLAFQAALVALALAGLARADEPVSPTLRILLSVPRHPSDH